MLLSLMNHPTKHLIDKADIPGCFAGRRPELLLTMGAGDIDLLVEPIENYFKNE